MAPGDSPTLSMALIILVVQATPVVLLGKSVSVIQHSRWPGLCCISVAGRGATISTSNVRVEQATPVVLCHPALSMAGIMPSIAAFVVPGSSG
ncbi:hypothetical protein DFS34DRAFT_647774 [Phlyctochytrium arcticum]|nr:hypothetical protein DFS34DRAFT_647774 [Phlyctochytrium arcticum]